MPESPVTGACGTVHGEPMSSENPTAEPRRSAHRTPPKRGIRWPVALERLPRAVRWGLVVAGVVLLVLTIGAGADVALSAGRIHPGVSVGPIRVGGMTVEEASTEIAFAVADRSTEPVEIRVADGTWPVTGDQIALSVDATTMAQQAFAVGRGDVGPAIIERVRSVFGGMTVPLALGYDHDAMAGVLDAINESVGTPPVNADVEVEGTAVTRVAPADGRGIDADAAVAGVLAAFMADDRSVTLELGTLPPAMDAEAVEGAYQDALAMVSAPLTLYYGEKEWEVPAATIGDWVGFQTVGTGDATVLEVYVVTEEVSSSVLPMVAQVGKPAKNATFKASSGSVSIVPAEDGLAADAEDLATRLLPVLTGAGERRAELTMHRVAPEITTEEAGQMGITERLSTFTTEYASSNKPRVNNIHLLADALNGTLIAPGDTFDFNQTIGPRTAEKGYQEANAIVNGKLVPQLGGGICQIGTTIFNTVFFSGLPVVERHNHSLYISHYPKGRDATVSWNGPNFKFKNDTPNWILVATSYTNSSVTISLYGTNPGYKVTYETGPWTNLVDPPVKEIKDPTLPVGSKVVEERGVSGRTIVVIRTVTKNGSVIRTDTFKSVYKPAEEVVRVGTKPVSSTPATSTP